MNSFRLTMHTPLANYQDVAATAINMAARPATLDGKVVGLLPNWRPSAAHILSALGAVLQERYKLKELILEQPVRELPVTKGKIIDGIREKLDELAGQVDVVITASGD